ncbi:MAG: hypothetical protein A2Z34_05060 [Planctomycetes bacterium RBG_16_59_8]|nr:MAG: hypothetical protein A2Z34_05060 [Planctomycetes bacterium RBG_16_59_8]
MFSPSFPLSAEGSVSDIFVGVVDTPISAEQLLREVGGEDRGAAVLFLGTVRDHNEGKRVLQLNYSAYREMAERELAKVASSVREKWGMASVAILHRVGEMKPGEVSVAIAVAAGHRKGTFDACREAIETLKKSVPIWKEEIYEDGRQWLDCSKDHEHGEGKRNEIA